MLPYARLRPGPGFRAGRTGLYFAQRLVTMPKLRGAVSRAIASAIRLRHGMGSWAPPSPRYAGVAAVLRRDGIAMLDGLVDCDAASRIQEYFLARDVVTADGRSMPLGRLPAGSGMAAYPMRTVLENADVMALVNSAAVLRTVADYLGCKPTLSSLGVRWSFPGTKPVSATQQFHRDPDDWQFLKFFVYLTDVDGESGPHAYVAQSHRTAGHVRARPYSRPSIDREFGSDKVQTVCGPRGTAFVADTYGIHAGLVPTHRSRLILQAQYSLLPVFAFRYDPIAVPQQYDIDPYINRLLVGKSSFLQH